MYFETPARRAFARAVSIAFGSISEPRARKSVSRTAASASSRAASHIPDGSAVNFSPAKERKSPGARFVISITLSIAIVPEPQKGSQSITSSRRRAFMTSAAASVSRSGAALASGRYPRLWSATPEVSIISDASSLKMKNSIWYFTPVSGMRTRPYFPPRRSAVAFFIMLWQSGREVSALFIECPFTGNASFLPIKRSHSSDFVPS